MTVRVIVPPAPIVTPADIPGDHAANDAVVLSMIAAAQEDIDGPTGWLGRALGVQTLELTVEHPCSPIIRLPFPPILEVLAAWSGDDEVPVDQYVPGAPSIAFGFGALLTAGKPVRIRYRAGYNGQPVVDDGTGPVPERARQAIILTVKSMMDMTTKDVFQTQESVVGISSKARSVTPYVSQAVREAADNLLHRLRVYT